MSRSWKNPGFSHIEEYSPGPIQSPMIQPATAPVQPYTAAAYDDPAPSSELVELPEVVISKPLNENTLEDNIEIDDYTLDTQPAETSNRQQFGVTSQVSVQKPARKSKIIKQVSLSERLPNIDFKLILGTGVAIGLIALLGSRGSAVAKSAQKAFDYY